MQKFVHETQPPSIGHPTPEELAAYIDGNLGEDEVARITGHLASCEDCYDVYSMATRFLLESEPAPPKDNLVPFPQREVRSWWPAAAAAVALLAVGGGAGGYLLLPPPTLTPDKVAGSVRGNAEVSGNLWLGPTQRGSGVQGKEVDVDPAAFQMGVQLVNLQVKLAANDGRGSEDVVARILQVLDNQYFVDDLKKSYGDITTSIENKTPAKDLVGKTSQLAQQTRESLDASHVDFGQWVEAGYLSSQAQDPAFFQRSDTRSFLRRLRWRDRVGLGDTRLDPTTRESLDRISDVVSKGDLRPSDYAELKSQFAQILGFYYPDV